jgi:hypothetical protein
MSKIFVTYIEEDQDYDAIQKRWKQAFPKNATEVSPQAYVKFSDKTVSVKSLIKKYEKEYFKSIKYLQKHPEEFLQPISPKSPFKKLESFNKISFYIGFSGEYNITFYIVGRSGLLEYVQVFKIQKSEDFESFSLDESIKNSVFGVKYWGKKKSIRSWTPMTERDFDRDRGKVLVYEI